MESKKNKHYFIRIAVLKTIITGWVYLMMPIAATLYNNYVPDGYTGYTFLGGGIMIIGNMILLIRAWGIALDKDLRKNYLNEN